MRLNKGLQIGKINIIGKGLLQASVQQFWSYLHSSMPMRMGVIWFDRFAPVFTRSLMIGKFLKFQWITAHEVDSFKEG